MVRQIDRPVVLVGHSYGGAVDSSHLVMLSHPAEVVSVIQQAMEPAPA